jgi:hypothetical protein
MKKHMTILPILLLLLLVTPAEAQNRRMIFKGKVLDRETRAPVKGANITSSAINPTIATFLCSIPSPMTMKQPCAQQLGFLPL